MLHLSRKCKVGSTPGLHSRPIALHRIARTATCHGSRRTLRGLLVPQSPWGRTLLGSALFRSWSSVSGQMSSTAVASQVTVAAPTSPPNQGVAVYHFRVPHKAAFGEQLALVGSCEALGNWKTDNAAKLTWNDGHVWTGQVELPAGQMHEFKLVIFAGSQVMWEAGANRAIVDTVAGLGTASKLSVGCYWGKPEQMSVEAMELVGAAPASQPVSDDQHEEVVAAARAAIAAAGGDSSAPPAAEQVISAFSTLYSKQGTTVTCTMVVPHYQSVPGQQLVVVGPEAPLGQWNPAEGLKLEWQEGHAWQGDVELPVSALEAGMEVKLVVYSADDPAQAIWEQGANRGIQVNNLQSTPGNQVIVVMEWDNPASTTITTAPAGSSTATPATRSTTPATAPTLAPPSAAAAAAPHQQQQHQGMGGFNGGAPQQQQQLQQQLQQQQQQLKLQLQQQEQQLQQQLQQERQLKQQLLQQQQQQNPDTPPDILLNASVNRLSSLINKAKELLPSSEGKEPWQQGCGERPQVRLWKKVFDPSTDDPENGAPGISGFNTNAAAAPAAAPAGVPGAVDDGSSSSPRKVKKVRVVKKVKVSQKLKEFQNILEQAMDGSAPAGAGMPPFAEAGLAAAEALGADSGGEGDAARGKREKREKATELLKQAASMANDITAAAAAAAEAPAVEQQQQDAWGFSAPAAEVPEPSSTSSSSSSSWGFVSPADQAAEEKVEDAWGFRAPADTAAESKSSDSWGFISPADQAVEQRDEDSWGYRAPADEAPVQEAWSFRSPADQQAEQESSTTSSSNSWGFRSPADEAKEEDSWGFRAPADEKPEQSNSWGYISHAEQQSEQKTEEAWSFRAPADLLAEDTSNNTSSWGYRAPAEEQDSWAFKSPADLAAEQQQQQPQEDSWGYTAPAAPAESGGQNLFSFSPPAARSEKDLRPSSRPRPRKDRRGRRPEEDTSSSNNSSSSSWGYIAPADEPREQDTWSFKAPADLPAETTAEDRTEHNWSWQAPADQPREHNSWGFRAPAEEPVKEQQQQSNSWGFISPADQAAEERSEDSFSFRAPADDGAAADSNSWSFRSPADDVAESSPGNSWGFISPADQAAEQRSEDAWSSRAPAEERADDNGGSQSNTELINASWFDKYLEEVNKTADANKDLLQEINSYMDELNQTAEALQPAATAAGSSRSGSSSNNNPFSFQLPSIPNPLESLGNSLESLGNPLESLSAFMRGEPKPHLRTDLDPEPPRHTPADPDQFHLEQGPGMEEVMADIKVLIKALKDSGITYRIQNGFPEVIAVDPNSYSPNGSSSPRYPASTSSASSDSHNVNGGGSSYEAVYAPSSNGNGAHGYANGQAREEDSSSRAPSRSRKNSRAGSRRR